MAASRRGGHVLGSEHVTPPHASRRPRLLHRGLRAWRRHARRRTGQLDRRVYKRSSGRNGPSTTIHPPPFIPKTSLSLSAVLSSPKGIEEEGSAAMPSLWPTTRKRRTGTAVRTRRRGTSLRGLWRRVVGPVTRPRARTRPRTHHSKAGLLSRAARVLSCTRRPRAY